MNRNIGYGTYPALEIPRTDPAISPHFVTFLGVLVLMEGGLRADLERIQNPAEAARALTYFIHR